jgi:peptidoglycan/xylan/chitin deacetylase (PgdA/CDA1 family)
LAAEGHEIESHTFGHLYVRGTTPDELERDLREWNQAAEALGLPPARSFAFPWKSSNSVKEPHYERMVDVGITSLTRMYSLRQGAEFELDEVDGMPGLLIYPDRIIESNADGAAVGRRTIDEVLLRRGYTSLWTHPEAVVDPAEVTAWREVIDYAAAARARGLWVTGLVEILERVRAGRQVELVALRDGPATLLVLENTAREPVRGIVAELTHAGEYIYAGAVWSDSRGQRVRAPELPAEASVTMVQVPERAA